MNPLLRRARRLGAAMATTAVLMSTAVGCGGDQPQVATPTGNASAAPTEASDSSSTSPGANASSSAPVGTEPTDSASPTATYVDAPATGEALQVTGLSLRVPAEGWGPVGTEKYSAAVTNLTFTAQVAARVGISSTGTPVEQGPELFNSSSGYPVEQAVQPTVVIAGQEWWHVAGDAGLGQYVEAFGTVTPTGDDVTVTFVFFPGGTKDQQRARLIGPVLASATFS